MAEERELTPSSVIWAIMAVSARWLVALLVLAIGYAATECIWAGCVNPAPHALLAWSVVLADGLFVLSGYLGWRMTGTRVAWLAVIPALLVHQIL